MKKTVITILISFSVISAIAASDYIINKDFAVVKTQSVSKQTVTRYIKASGIVKEQNKREIKVEIPLTVEDVYIEVGSKIAKDQKLFKLDKEALKNKIELENFKSYSEAAENIIAKINNYNSYVTSPINGIVTKINVEKGSEINVNEPLAIVSDLDNLVIKVNVPESLISDVYEGQAVIIKGKSFSNQIKGSVSKIYPIAEEAEKNSQTYVTVNVKAESYDNIKPGTSVDAEFEKENKRAAVIIPFDSVMFDEETPYVFINRYGYAVKRYVNLGEEYEVDVEILSGINVNDKLILNPKSQKLSQGDKVSVID